MTRRTRPTRSLQLLAFAVAILAVAFAVCAMTLVSLQRRAPLVHAEIGPTIAVGTPSVDAPTGNVQVPINAAGSGFGPYWAFNIHLRWDHSLLSFSSATAAGGLFDPSTGTSSCNTITFFDSDGGGAIFACGASAQRTGSGLLATISLTPLGLGCSPLHLFTFGPPDGGDTKTGTFTVSASLGVQNDVYIDGSIAVAGASCGAVATNTPADTPTATNRPTTTATPTPVQASSAVIFNLSPANQTVPFAAGAAQLAMEIDHAYDVAAFEFVLRYDPAVLTEPLVQLGPFLGRTGRAVFCPAAIIDSVAGSLQYGCASIGFGYGVDGSGVLATVSFKLIRSGSTSIDVEKAFVINVNADDLCPCLAYGATIDITVPTSPPTPTLTSTATATPRPLCTGDVNGDGLVNVRDLVLVARRMGTRVSERRYDARFDLNRDGRINVRDLMIVIRRLGAICR